MTMAKIAIMVFVIVGVALGLNPAAWAGAGDNTGCLTDESTLGGKFKPKGKTMQFTVAYGEDRTMSPQRAIISVRTQWQGAEKHFAVLISPSEINSSIDLMCDMLDADADGTGSGTATVEDTIKSAYGIDTAKRIQVTNSSFSGSGFQIVPGTSGTSEGGVMNATAYVQ